MVYIFIVCNLISTAIVYFIDIKYIASFQYGFFAYIFLMLVNIKVISKRIDNEILNAKSQLDKEEFLHCRESRDCKKYQHLSDVNTKSAKNFSLEKNLIENLVLNQISPISNQALQNQDMKNQHTNKKYAHKKILRFLDLSKLKLGLEIWFNFYRILVFLILSCIFIVLVYFNLFYGLATIAGVTLGSILMIVNLLFK